MAAAAAAADGTRQSLQGGPPKAELPRIDDLPGTDNVDQGNAGSDDIGAGDDYYDEDDDDEYSSSGDELGTLGRVEDADWELARGGELDVGRRADGRLVPPREQGWTVPCADDDMPLFRLHKDV